MEERFGNFLPKLLVMLTYFKLFRLGWAIDNPLLRRKEIMGLLPPKEKKLQTAQVHYSFITTRRTPLTEELFRAVFEQFGPVLDVAIKKCQHHQVSLY